LTETLDQLQLSAAAAKRRDVDQKDRGGNDLGQRKSREIWGFSGGEQFTRGEFLNNIHPADRELFLTTVQGLEGGK
jgi:hypothetical protein